MKRAAPCRYGRPSVIEEAFLEEEHTSLAEVESVWAFECVPSWAVFLHLSANC